MSSSRFILNMLEEEEDDDDTTWAIAVASVQQLNQSKNRQSHWGSVLNHRVIDRNRLDGHNRLFHDYFAENPTYPDNLFRRRFRMSRPLFLRIQQAVELHDEYFVQRRNATGALGLSSLQKITAALRMLAYGVSADAVDEYLRLGSSTSIESLRRFVRAIVEIFGNEYLRKPNENDIMRLMEKAEERGFPGMLNDINVLDRSHLFSELAEGRGPNVRYMVNGHEYNIGYYLADGIYPPWPTFVKTISSPKGNKRKLFAAAQESARKDVERAFGVLQARFAIVRGPSRFWDVESLKYIMTTCIILHNMIIEDERDTNYNDFNYDEVSGTPTCSLNHSPTIELTDFIQFHHQIRNKQAHYQLQEDLIEHLWNMYGDSDS